MMLSHSYAVVALSHVQTLSLPITRFYAEQECYCHLLLGCSCFCLSHKKKGVKTWGWFAFVGRILLLRDYFGNFLNEGELLNKSC